MVQIKALSVLVAKNIKRVRSEKGLTQEECAERCKFHYKFMQRLEDTNGRCKPTLSTLARLADGLKVHPQEFLRPFRKRTKK